MLLKVEDVPLLVVEIPLVSSGMLPISKPTKSMLLTFVPLNQTVVLTKHCWGVSHCTTNRADCEAPPRVKQTATPKQLLPDVLE